VRLELQESEGERHYNATILYPGTAGAYSRSEIFSHDLYYDPSEKSWSFRNYDDVIHPKILKMEPELSAAIIAAK
jgi:hypothetical protein